jgi:hypothetical protein
VTNDDKRLYFGCSAAIYGLRNKERVECFILFPEGRVSPIQQLQMTSVLDENVHCVAVQGTFDDCQDIVKALFRDLKFKKTYSLGAVNSINFARIMFQITYYFYSYFKLFPNCDGEISFSVPTGNFGDILAVCVSPRKAPRTPNPEPQHLKHWNPSLVSRSVETHLACARNGGVLRAGWGAVAIPSRYRHRAALQVRWGRCGALTVLQTVVQTVFNVVGASVTASAAAVVACER